MYIYRRTKKFIISKYSTLSSWLIPVYFMGEIFKLGMNFIGQRRYSPFKKKPHIIVKKCIFTVLIGDYDDLQDPEVVTAGWDYICITNNPNLKSDQWKIVHVNDPDLDAIRASRKYKICNHLVDSKYDVSIYIDANIAIKGNLDAFLSISWKASDKIAILYHPYHTGVVEEFNACLHRNLDNSQTIIDQKNQYFQHGFSDKFPQVNNRLIIRKTNCPHVKTLMDNWFNEVLNHSFRDQLSFNYVHEKQVEVRAQYIEYWKFRAYFLKKNHKH